MKKKGFNTVIGTFLLTLFLFSCSSDLDFNQANDLKLEPIVVANLTYFDIVANQFVDNGIEQRVVFDAENFDVFKDSFFRDNLKRTDFFFQINNTVNRAFTINILLLDINDQTLYSIPFVIRAYNGSPNTITQTEVFENDKLELLKETKKLGFVIAMEPGDPINANTLGSLQLRSSATVYFEIK